jgi:hypothetical protein
VHRFPSVCRSGQKREPDHDYLTMYCFEDEDVEDIAENMAEQQVRRLPAVSRNKRLVGIAHSAVRAHGAPPTRERHPGRCVRSGASSGSPATGSPTRPSRCRRSRRRQDRRPRRGASGSPCPCCGSAPGNTGYCRGVFSFVPLSLAVSSSSTPIDRGLESTT